MAFSSRQIVCLDHPPARLYGEVIQVVDSAQTCWLRPWVLVTEELTLDAREASDIVYPLALFRAAEDWEFLSLLPILDAKDPKGDAKPQLRRFLEGVWRARPELFRR
ncbi:MAG: hypothetical protein GC158_07130 [Cyanobacteria bacterium RI_101]|nr:hypothetical protein [Cyanobacteria bacterium RI_101]